MNERSTSTLLKRQKAEIASAVARLSDVGVALDELKEKIAGATVNAYADLSGLDPQGLKATVDLSSGGVRIFDQSGHPMVLSSGETRRLAALVPKIILQWLEEIERARLTAIAMPLYLHLVDGVLERKEGSTWLLKCPQFPAVLPSTEQMPGENLSEDAHLSVVVLGSRPAPARPGIVVSRSHPALILRLLEAEIPEIATGKVAVNAIAREAGRRTKIAVSSKDPAIDPQGACIGPHGIRHRALMQRLGDEQLQFVPFDQDISTFIKNAIAPAHPISTDLNFTARKAVLTVPRDELPAAIGRSGENARLAARLTGWTIDIHTPDTFTEAEKDTPLGAS